MPKMPGTTKCPQCERWARMEGGKCEFCGAESEILKAERFEAHTGLPYERPVQRARGRCPGCKRFGMTTEGVCVMCGYRMEETIPESHTYESLSSTASSPEYKRARARLVLKLLDALAELTPNARDFERPSGFSVAYEAWEWVADQLHRLLDVAQES